MSQIDAGTFGRLLLGGLQQGGEYGRMADDRNQHADRMQLGRREMDLREANQVEDNRRLDEQLMMAKQEARQRIAERDASRAIYGAMAYPDAPGPMDGMGPTAPHPAEVISRDILESANPQAVEALGQWRQNRQAMAQERQTTLDELRGVRQKGGPKFVGAALAARKGFYDRMVKHNLMGQLAADEMPPDLREQAQMDADQEKAQIIDTLTILDANEDPGHPAIVKEFGVWAPGMAEKFGRMHIDGPTRERYQRLPLYELRNEYNRRTKAADAAAIAKARASAEGDFDPEAYRALLLRNAVPPDEADALVKLGIAGRVGKTGSGIAAGVLGVANSPQGLKISREGQRRILDRGVEDARTPLVAMEKRIEDAGGEDALTAMVNNPTGNVKSDQIKEARGRLEKLQEARATLKMARERQDAFDQGVPWESLPHATAAGDAAGPASSLPTDRTPIIINGKQVTTNEVAGGLNAVEKLAGQAFAEFDRKHPGRAPDQPFTEAEKAEWHSIYGALVGVPTR